MGNGKYKRLIPPIFIAILALTLISLFSGSSWLTWELVQGVPMGNLAVCISLVTITGLNYKYLAEQLGHPSNKKRREFDWRCSAHRR